MDTETNPGSIAPFQELLSLGGRCLFRTKRGHVGIGRRDTRVKDVVTVLHGGWVPYVLRFVDPEIGDYMTLMGDSFVHDIMNGQIYIMKEEGCMKGTFGIHKSLLVTVERYLISILQLDLQDLVLARCQISCLYSAMVRTVARVELRVCTTFRTKGHNHLKKDSRK
jgi:hypothetical protein